jgi:hypothetical protein
VASTLPGNDVHQVAVDDSGRGKRFFAYHTYYDYNSRAFRNRTEVLYERTMAQGKFTSYWHLALHPATLHFWTPVYPFLDPAPGAARWKTCYA